MRIMDMEPGTAVPQRRTSGGKSRWNLHRSWKTAIPAKTSVAVRWRRKNCRSFWKQAGWPPTAKNLQEQRVYVVQSEEGLKKIDAVTPCRYGAPTCLVVAFDKNHVFTYPGEKRDSGVEDASIVATHMMLAAANAGVDSCWLNFFDPDKAAKELGLPENEEVLMILDLGYAAEGVGPLPNHASRKPLEETVVYC